MQDIRIEITLANREKRIIRSQYKSAWMSLNFSASGNMTIYDGAECLFKEPLDKIRSVFYQTEKGRVVAYKRNW